LEKKILILTSHLKDIKRGKGLCVPFCLLSGWFGGLASWPAWAQFLFIFFDFGEF
jgi:hypothetical protein